MKLLADVLRAAALIARKDLTLEWRNRARLLSIVLFAVVVLLLLSMALGPDTETLRRAAAGCLAVGLLFSSTLALGESFRLEREDAALEGLILLPVDPVGLFLGKFAANALFLSLLSVVLIPTTVVLFAVEPDGSDLLRLGATWLLASIGLAAPGTLYATMTSRLRSQDVMLPLLLFPLVVPVMTASVKSFSLILGGDPMEQLASWSGLLIAFDVIYGCLCAVLFPFILDEG